MDTFRILLLAACIGISGAATAATSAYELLIVACRDGSCRRVTEQNVSAGAVNQTEYSYSGLRLLIETLGHGTNEENARISINVRPSDDGNSAWRSTPATRVEGLEALVVLCKLRHGMFSSLTTFVRDGTTYQIWGRLVAMQ